MLAAASAALSLAGLAQAQVGLSTKPDYDRIYAAERVDEYTDRDLTTLHKIVVEALNAKDYATAEKAVAALVGRKPTTTDASFLMGLAKIGLEKWDEARSALEAAVQKEPTRPEPKTRLGLVYVKLGNLDAAKSQRAELTTLDAACGQSCKDATWIKDGMILLDQALGAPASATLVATTTPSGAPADTLTAETLNFDPARYNLVTFADTADLYDLLTRDGRCAPKTLAEPRQPCALILYRPDEAVPGGLSANFKPVFRVDSRTAVWAIHDKKPQKLKIEDLYFDIEQIIGEKKTTYRSIALVGNAENKANCDKGAPCLGNLVAQDMFRMYGNMPDSVVKVIWGGGMEDVGTVRIR
jgi:tetratricopeptide (TPR) repeat protein